jgi:hypothetical protein
VSFLRADTFTVGAVLTVYAMNESETAANESQRRAFYSLTQRLFELRETRIYFEEEPSDFDFDCDFDNEEKS